VAAGGLVCEFLSLLASLVHCCADSSDCGGVSVYMCEWPIWPCTVHRGPCIANSIYPPSL
jgi:hypothetical protein